jgi:hypothetical protein
VTAHAVEIEARRCRDAGLFEHAFAEGGRVVREAANVCIDVERAVGRMKIGDADFR